MQRSIFDAVGAETDKMFRRVDRAAEAAPSSVEEQYEEARTAQRHHQLLGGLLEVRIRMQPALELCNRLPPPRAHAEFRKAKPAQCDAPLAETAEAARSLLGALLALQSASDGAPAEDDDDGDGERDSAPPLVGLPLDAVWARVAAAGAQREPAWRAAVARCHAATSKVGQLAATRVFESVRLGPWEQVDAALADHGRARRRAHPARVDVVPIGRALAGESDDENDDVGDGEGDVALELEAYDDADTYAQLVKEYVAGHGGDGAPGGSGGGSAAGEVIAQGGAVAADAAAEAARAAARKRKKGARADLDRRATKGRKIKYVVHPKLQEFCCPVPRDAIGAGAARITDELFASLFGGGSR